MSDEELIARLREVDVSWSQVGEDCAAAADRIEALLKEREKLRKALEFYGNSSLYDWDGNPDHLKPIERDAGRTAHIALGYLPATEADDEGCPYSFDEEDCCGGYCGMEEQHTGHPSALALIDKP